MRGVAPSLPEGVSVEREGPLLRVVGQFRGFVTGPRDLGVEGAALDRLIQAQRDYFAARGEAVEWKTRGHDLPADLPDRLRTAGFTPHTPETVVIGEAARMADPTPTLPPGVTLRRVTADADMHRVGALEEKIWGGDFGPVAEDLIGRVASAPDQIAVYVAEAAGEVVSAAWLALRPGTDFASLWGGSTLPQWRGRGIYRALVAVRAALAATRGVRYLHVDASDDSRPILERLGFTAVTTTTPYVWTPDTPRTPDES
ncbi:GNAT family N-acetyltransferase [Streptomyces sp. enrichment culture]|uniref:GNAT family N-acetyltransferase n=1 Tax=Streptomyces sp. enrichment culture TaxID=1795815 RepID=UPI003F542835